MERSRASGGAPAETRLRTLAAAGAQMVRLAVNVNEVTPTFVPARVVPFVQQANALGMIVVLGWDATLGAPINNRVDDAEDWVREAVTYLGDNPGVWFDLYNGVDAQSAQSVSPLRQRNIAQRLVDVARGFRAHNVIVLNDPLWLLSSDAATREALSGDNLVYGLDARAAVRVGQAGGYDLAAAGAPFLVTRAESDVNELQRLHELGVGTVVSDTAAPSAQVQAFWKAHAVDWSICRT
jgi:hypothetical protein